MTDTGAHGWAEAMRRALDAAVAQVAQPGDGKGNPSGTENTIKNQSVERGVAQNAQVAPPWADCGGDPRRQGEPVDGWDDFAEREAIQAEPPLPPPGSAARAKLDEAQSRMVAGLLRAAVWPPAAGRLRGRESETIV